MKLLFLKVKGDNDHSFKTIISLLPYNQYGVINFMADPAVNIDAV